MKIKSIWRIWSRKLLNNCSLFSCLNYTLLQHDPWNPHSDNQNTPTLITEIPIPFHSVHEMSDVFVTQTSFIKLIPRTKDTELLLAVLVDSAMRIKPTALFILMDPLEIALKTDVMGFCQQNSSPALSRCLITLSEPAVLLWFYLMCFLPLIKSLGIHFTPHKHCLPS